MTLSVQSATKTISQHAYTWGGGGAMLGALALYYYKSDSTLYNWLSGILGIGGLMGLGYGIGNSSSNTNTNGQTLLTATNVSSVSRPIVDVKTFLNDIKKKSSALNFADISDIKEVRETYKNKFKENQPQDDCLISILKDGDMHQGIRLAAADTLISTGKETVADDIVRDPSFIKIGVVKDINLMIKKEVIKALSKPFWYNFYSLNFLPY